MSKFDNSITTDLYAIKAEWSNVRDKTTSKISTMKNYYSAGNPVAEVVQKTDRDYKDLKDDFNRWANKNTLKEINHQDLELRIK